jgi:hypothetical protein
MLGCRTSGPMVFTLLSGTLTPNDDLIKSRGGTAIENR